MQPQYSQGAAPSHHPLPYVPSEVSQSNGGSITSSLRQWRKKDFVEKQHTTEPSTTIGENLTHVARVAPHAYYPRVANDVCHYQPQFGDYSVPYKSQAPATVKYSEIVENQQPQNIEHITPVLTKHKDKEFVDLANIPLQTHIKQYQEHLPLKQQYTEVVKQPYSDPPPSHHQFVSKEPQMHPLFQKQPQMHQYQQFLPKYNMQTQYGQSYPSEPNNFLAHLNKINPRMAHSIINDTHLRDSQIPMYSNLDQGRSYSQPQSMYRTQSVHSSPNHPHRNLPPQAYNFSQTYGYNIKNNIQAGDPYNRVHQYQNNVAKYLHEQTIPNISPQRMYSENVHMNYAPMPPKISPNYPHCSQLEYAQHYQHRRQISQEYFSHPSYKPTYVQNSQMSPEDNIESSTRKSSLKQYLESWVEEDMSGNLPDIIISNNLSDIDNIEGMKGTMCIKSNGSQEQPLYVLDTTEIANENLPHFLHLQQFEKLPDNIRGYYHSTSTIQTNSRRIIIENNFEDAQNNRAANKVEDIKLPEIFAEPTKSEKVVNKEEKGTSENLEEKVVQLHILENAEAVNSNSNSETVIVQSIPYHEESDKTDSKEVALNENNDTDVMSPSQNKSMPTIDEALADLELKNVEKIPVSEQDADLNRSLDVEVKFKNDNTETPNINELHTKETDSKVEVISNIPMIISPTVISKSKVLNNFEECLNNFQTDNCEFVIKNETEIMKSPDSKDVKLETSEITGENMNSEKKEESTIKELKEATNSDSLINTNTDESNIVPNKESIQNSAVSDGISEIYNEPIHIINSEENSDKESIETNLSISLIKCEDFISEEPPLNIFESSSNDEPIELSTSPSVTDIELKNSNESIQFSPKIENEKEKTKSKTLKHVTFSLNKQIFSRKLVKLKNPKPIKNRRLLKNRKRQSRNKSRHKLKKYLEDKNNEKVVQPKGKIESNSDIVQKEPPEALIEDKIEHSQTEELKESAITTFDLDSSSENNSVQSLKEVELKMPHLEKEIDFINIEQPVIDENDNFQPSVVYQINDTNVVLQIADELLEINVTTQNGKKVISVKTFSDAVILNNTEEASCPVLEDETAVNYENPNLECEENCVIGIAEETITSVDNDVCIFNEEVVSSSTECKTQILSKNEEPNDEKKLATNTSQKDTEAEEKAESSNKSKCLNFEKEENGNVLHCKQNSEPLRKTPKTKAALKFVESSIPISITKNKDSKVPRHSTDDNKEHKKVVKTEKNDNRKAEHNNPMKNKKHNSDKSHSKSTHSKKNESHSKVKLTHKTDKVKSVASPHLKSSFKTKHQGGKNKSNSESSVKKSVHFAVDDSKSKNKKHKKEIESEDPSDKIPEIISNEPKMIIEPEITEKSKVQMKKLDDDIPTHPEQPQENTVSVQENSITSSTSQDNESATKDQVSKLIKETTDEWEEDSDDIKVTDNTCKRRLSLQEYNNRKRKNSSSESTNSKCNLTDNLLEEVGIKKRVRENSPSSPLLNVKFNNKTYSRTNSTDCSVINNKEHVREQKEEFLSSAIELSLPPHKRALPKASYNQEYLKNALMNDLHTVRRITHTLMKENQELMERFLDQQRLTPGELEKVKEIIRYKRLVQHLTSLKENEMQPINIREHLKFSHKKIEDKKEQLSATSVVDLNSLSKLSGIELDNNAKLHLKKFNDIDKRKKKRFRFLYSEDEFEQTDSLSYDSPLLVNSEETKPPHLENLVPTSIDKVMDYSVHQSTSQGQLTLVFKRSFRNNLKMQPFVKLERLSSIEELAKNSLD